MRAIGRLAAVTLLLPLLMGTEVYRWVDENGVVNYTQTKPRGVEAVQRESHLRDRVDARADDEQATQAPLPHP